MSWEIGWLMFGGLFLAIEGAALFQKEGTATLSYHVWKWAGIKDKPRGYKQRRLALLAFLTWLVTHFLTGGWV